MKTEQSDVLCKVLDLFEEQNGGVIELCDYDDEWADFEHIKDGDSKNLKLRMELLVEGKEISEIIKEFQEC